MRVCAASISRRHINVCNGDLFSVVNVYHDHFNFGVVCINGRRYVSCSECNGVSNECNDPTLPCATYQYIRWSGDVFFI